MNRRIARKIIDKSCPSNYWDTWYHPEKQAYIKVPHSGKHWYLILKACATIGGDALEFQEGYTNHINRIING